METEPGRIRAFAGLEESIRTKGDGSFHSIRGDDYGFRVTRHNDEYKDDGIGFFYNLVRERG